MQIALWPDHEMGVQSAIYLAPQLLDGILSLHLPFAHDNFSCADAK